MKGRAKQRKENNEEKRKRRGRRRRSITKRQRRWDKGLTRSCVMWYDQRRDCVRSSGLLRCLEPRWFKDEDEASCHLDPRFSNCPPWTLPLLPWPGGERRTEKRIPLDENSRWRSKEKAGSPIRCNNYRIRFSGIIKW